MYNAANEQAVAFFWRTDSFGDIPRAIAAALDRSAICQGGTREELLAADAAARRHVMELF